eukprot:6199026-Prorocentrum_lima.AAC.1
MALYLSEGQPHSMRTPQFERMPTSTGDGHYFVVKDPKDLQNIVSEGVIGRAESTTAVAGTTQHTTT